MSRSWMALIEILTLVVVSAVALGVCEVQRIDRLEAYIRALQVEVAACHR